MNPKSYKCCAVSQCNNTTVTTPNKLFVYVPHNKTMRNKWLNLAHRDPASVSQNSGLYFCEDHFDLPNDMANYMQYHVMGSVSQVRMKPGCVPSKFNYQPNKKKRKPGATSRKDSVEKCEKNIKERKITKKQLDHGAVSSTSSDLVTNEDVNELFHIQLKADKACQTNLFSESNDIETTTSNNRYTYSDHCDTQIQIAIAPKLIPRNTSNVNYIQCSCKKTYADKSTTVDSKYFVISNTVYEPIMQNSELSDIATIKSEPATENAEYSELATIKIEPATEREEFFEISIIKSETASEIEEFSDSFETISEPVTGIDECSEIVTIKSESATKSEEVFENSTIKSESVSDIEDYSENLTTNSKPTT